MKKQFLIGLLLVFIFAVQTEVRPTETAGVNSFAIEQTDEVTLEATTMEQLITFDLVEVGIVPGSNLLVSTEIATREQSVNLITGRLENINYAEVEDLCRQVRYTATKATKVELTDNYMLNHKLYEISFGDNLG
jgi:hypothetical protein